jgi:hypothetical protein
VGSRVVAPGGILAPQPGMSERVDALDCKPGSPPDIRMVGNSVLVVFPIECDSTAPNVRLMLRLESNGELFAAISSPLDHAE